MAGVENRVAFEAAMSDGQQVDGQLTVGNQTAETVNRGRGMFSVVPESGHQEEVTFVSTNGERVVSLLPKPEEEGVAIQVRQQQDSIFIKTHIVGLDAERLALTVMHEGKVEAFHALAEGQTLSIADLSAGIHQVTAFDVDGHVFADRLFFVVRPELSKPTLVVTGLREEYRPYEKVEMKLKREYKSTLALAKTATKSGLLVHAELTALDTRETQVKEEPFQGDCFQLDCPKFYGEKELFISVADTTGWNRGKMDRHF